MHEKGRYVKLANASVREVRRLALAALLLVPLWLAATGRADLVPGSAGAADSLLATAPDGSPRVAYVAADGGVVVAARDATGVWATQRPPLPPLAAPAIVGLAQAPAGLVVLVEAANGSRLVLAEQHGAAWTVRTVASRPAHGSLGFGALALDRSGRPLVAYATLLSSRKTALRLVHEDARGRLLGEAVTRDGFPESVDLPTVAPVVLADGSVRVVEAYSGAVIEWARTKSRKSWTGQFLFANSLAEPAGTLHAVADPAGGAWSAWTELFPTFAESQVILGENRDGQRTTVLDRHAFVVGLAETATGPEAAADDYVSLPGGRTVYAGLVVDAAGNALELAGNLEGYAVEPSGARQYLLLDGAGVEWFRSPTAPTASVSLSASADGAAFVLTGRVAGASGGAVEVDRETQSGTQLVATVPLAADGTFSLADTPPVRPLTYRAVYRDANGVPLAALVRGVLGG